MSLKRCRQAHETKSHQSCASMGRCHALPDIRTPECDSRMICECTWEEYERRVLKAAIAKSFEKQVDHGVRTKRKSIMPAKRWKKVVSTEPGGLGEG